MQFPVWRTLGLAWINQDGEPEVTEVGHAFVDAREASRRRELLARQLHRYQFHNPCFLRRFEAFRSFPVLALYRLLEQTEYRLDRTEMVLLGTRVRSFADADHVADLVAEWRALDRAAREPILTVARTIPAQTQRRSEEGAMWGTVQRGLPYLHALLRISPLLLVDDRAVRVPPNRRRELHRLVLAAAESCVFVDWKSEQDWLAWYGGLGPIRRRACPWTTNDDARAYYERVGEIDAAVSAFRGAPVRPAPAEVDRYRKAQVRERVLEDVLEGNLDALEKGLALIERQYRTAVGPIDLLARDQDGLYVVIELKRGRSADRVVGQIARYMGWVQRRLCGDKATRVRGIIVGSEFDRRFEAAIVQLKRVTPYTFDLRVSFSPWSPEGCPTRGAGGGPHRSRQHPRP